MVSDPLQNAQNASAERICPAKIFSLKQYSMRVRWGYHAYAFRRYSLHIGQKSSNKTSVKFTWFLGCRWGMRAWFHTGNAAAGSAAIPVHQTSKARFLRMPAFSPAQLLYTRKSVQTRSY
jgi:hypothetical protein